MSTIPVNPAPKVSMTFKEGEALNQNGLLRTLLASLLYRAEIKEIDFSQDDLNAVAGLILLEGKNEAGDLIIGLGVPEKPLS